MLGRLDIELHGASQASCCVLRNHFRVHVACPALASLYLVSFAHLAPSGEARLC